MKRILICLLLLVLFQLSFSQNNWIWQNPLPFGNIIWDIQFLDSSTAYGVGEYSLIFSTTDGGINWDYQYIGINEDFHAVHFVGNTGWIVGTGGKIYKTVNGTDWYEISSGVDYDLEDVYFIDQNNGWVSGWNGTILHSTDGGENWIAQTSGTIETCYAMEWLDASTGWIACSYGHILNTTDGGATWNSQMLTGVWNEFLDIDFIDANTGWACGGGGMIYHTTDGGANWTEQTSGSGMGLLDIDFLDANNGWAVGGMGDVVHTINGGANWTYQNVGDWFYDLHEIAWIDVGCAWLVGGEISSGYTGMFSTSDGGTNWDAHCSYETTDWLQNVFVKNENTCYIVGDVGSDILVTEDGGESWFYQTTEASHLDDIFFIDENTGWAAGSDSWSNIIVGTTDGGTTWTTQYSSNGMYFRGIHFCDANNGFAVGHSGIICHTSDGSTWEMQTYTIDIDLKDIFCYDANTAWAVGDWGTIYFTDNAGIDWISQTCPVADATLRSVWFTDANNGWICGSGGLVLHTSDGGINWFEQTTPTTEELSKIKFLDENIGLVVGNNGTMIATLDGGVIWEEYFIPSSLSLGGFDFCGNTGWLVGYGLIMKSVNGGGTPIDEEFMIVDPPKYNLTNYPNPFNPSTTIKFQLNTATTENPELSIYNLKGQKVKTFSNLQISQSPNYQIIWNGTDDSDRPVASGIYFYRLKVGEKQETSKMLLMK